MALGMVGATVFLVGAGMTIALSWREARRCNMSFVRAVWACVKNACAFIFELAP